MKIKLMLVGLLAIAGLASAQRPKSQKELEAVQAVISAQSPDAKIAAVDNLLAKFKDTEFKTLVLVMAGESARQKNDSATAIIYGTRALEADPKNAHALLLVAGQLAQGIKEFDLDKDEKVKRATKLANDALAAIPNAPKTNAQIPDEQWADIKKDMTSQAHETLGMLASVDKKYDAAIAEFKLAIESASTPQSSAMVRLAAIYTNAKHYDEATATADKVLAMPNLPESVKKFAQEEKLRAAKLKGGQ